MVSAESPTNAPLLLSCKENIQLLVTNQSTESFLLSLLLYSLIKVASHGMAERTQGMSGVNVHSSRSHAMLQLQLRSPNQQMAGR